MDPDVPGLLKQITPFPICPLTLQNNVSNLALLEKHFLTPPSRQGQLYSDYTQVLDSYHQLKDILSHLPPRRNPEPDLETETDNVPSLSPLVIVSPSPANSISSVTFYLFLSLIILSVGEPFHPQPHLVQEIQRLKQ